MMPIHQKLHKFKLKKKNVIDRQTWSLSDMVFAVPVLAAALANTLSGTGVNLKEKIVWYMYVKNKEDFHLKLICKQVQVCRCMHVFNIFRFNLFSQYIYHDTTLPYFSARAFRCFLFLASPTSGMFNHSSSLTAAKSLCKSKFLKTSLHEGL